jgi:phosphate starvation-inducible PhoH-like protein
MSHIHGPGFILATMPEQTPAYGGGIARERDPLSIEQVTERISLAGIDPLAILGPEDAYLRVIEDSSKARITARGDDIIVRGERHEVERLTRLFLELRGRVEAGEGLDREEIRHIIDRTRDVRTKPEQEPATGRIVLSSLRKIIRPKTTGQERYLEAIRDHDIVIGIGPAGTGKTYLAVAMGLTFLNERKVDRIILARPAVEAGESLGYLPGTLQEKVDPYLRPLYDALYEMMAPEKVRRLLEMGIIEVAPLAYMRGRTLNDSFVILDEAQNTTMLQMKMFLTRLGFNSKAVITGDITQIDLPAGNASGLVEIQTVLNKIDGIRFAYLTEKDVIRHRLVQEIIKAYEAFEAGRRA